MKCLRNISCLIFAIVVVGCSFSSLAQGSKYARINVTNDESPTVVTRTIDGTVLDDGCMIVISGKHRGDSLVLAPEVESVVGKIPYTSSVNANGKVSMSVPILDFASSFEVSPHLSLDYDGSSDFYDYMGYGWRINGISVIEKTVSDYFTDGNVDRFSSDSLAVFSLDGVRLIIQDDGSYLSQTGNICILKIDSKTFKALYPDGSTAIFSCDDKYPSIEGRLRYHIMERTMLDGQKITYSYKRNGNHYLCGGRMFVESISYGDGRQISFRYSSKCRLVKNDGRTEYNNRYAARKYVKGMPYNFFLKLDTIDVRKDKDLLTRYEINYYGQEIESPISSIYRMDSKGNSFKPLRLSYGASDSLCTWKKKTYTLGSYLNTDKLSKLNIRTGRFDNGSENEGLLMFPKKDAYTISDCKASCFKSNYSSKDTLVLSISIPNSGSAIPCGKIGLNRTFVEALAVNIDGKSGDEVAVIKEWQHPGGPNSPNSLYINVYSKGNKLPDKNYSMYNSRSFLIPCEMEMLPKTFLSGDFDGDGREEMLVLSHQIDGVGSTARLIDMGKGAIKGTFPIDSCHVVFPDNADMNDKDRAECYWRSDRIFVTDYDADGKPELCVMNKEGMKFYSFRYTSSGDIVMNGLKVNTHNNQFTNILNTDSLRNLDIFPGDFNGDGCTDFIIPMAGLYKAPTVSMGIENAYVATCIIIGNGNGGFIKPHEQMINIGLIRDGILENTIGQTLIADINRDGISDLIFELEKGGKTRTVAFTFRNGLSNCITQSLVFDERNMLIPCKALNTRVMDNHSVMELSPDGMLTYHKIAAPADMARCLTRIDDNQGTQRTFTYGRAYRANDFPVEETSSNQTLAFPYVSCADGRLICVREELKVAKTVEADITYSYKYPVAHLQGLGFCGFREVIAHDAITETETRRTFTPEKLGAPSSSITLVGGHNLSTELYDYTLLVNASKHIQSLKKEQVTVDHQLGVKVKERLNYDSYGNVTADTIFYDNAGTNVKTYEYENVCDENINLVGLLKEFTQTINRGNSSVTSGESRMYGGNHLLESTVQWTGESRLPVKTTAYNYDSKMRLIRTTTTPYSGTPLYSTQSYGGTNRAPYSVTDEKGVVTKYKYGGYGIISTCDQTNNLSFQESGAEINSGISLFSRPSVVAPGDGVEVDAEALGPLTKYYFDSFGRVDSVTCAYGGGIKNILQWAEESDSANYVLTVKEDGTPIKKTWYDCHDRKKREAVQRHDGSFLMTEYCYDNHGRICAVSAPFKISSTQWTAYTYDASGRLTQTDYPDGHSDVYQYEGLSIRSLIDGQEKFTIMDAMGLTAEIEDGVGGGSRIAYTYRADGKPERVTLGGVIATTFEYDDYGRQTAINDPSAGRRERAYDASGRIACETDARGKSVSCAYDDKGRIIRRVIDNGTIFEYTYDSHSNLIEMKTNGVVTRTYTYDEHSRLISMTESDYSKTWAYDGKNVESVAYFLNNSQICKEQYSRTLGTTTTVTINNGTQVWRLIGEDEKGQPTNIGFGSLTQQLSFDLAGRVTGRKVRYGNEPYIQNAAYEYDVATGNMMMRTDSIYGHEEAFAYDYLNRLTDNGTGGYAYDTKGNIVRRDGVGGYGYSSSSPYAVSEVPFNAMIPQRDQRINYNALQLPDSICEGGTTAIFTYGGDLQRSNMRISKGDLSITTNYYDGSLNRFDRTQGGATQRKLVLYLAGDAYSAPAALVRDYGADRWLVRHILRDNQGSIVAIADTAGNVIERNDYDPWGVLRQPQTQTPYSSGEVPELLLGRGYCGHEHLAEFGLINMNARLFDPALCRFLSPDPIVQAPDNSQNFNRYSYCLNNPLKYIDPSGLQFIYRKRDNRLEVEMDGVVVTAGRIKQEQWWEYYGALIPRVQYNVFSSRMPMVSNNDVHEGGTASSGQPNLFSLINTSISFPVSTINQQWNGILKTEYAQIIKLRQSVVTTAAPKAQKALQVKEAQYSSLSKASKALKSVSKATTITNIYFTGRDVMQDLENERKAKAAARGIVTAVSIGVNFIPKIGPFISTVIGLADAFYGEYLYDWVDSTF